MKAERAKKADIEKRVALRREIAEMKRKAEHERNIKKTQEARAARLKELHDQGHKSAAANAEIAAELAALEAEELKASRGELEDREKVINYDEVAEKMKERQALREEAEETERYVFITIYAE